MAKLGAGKENGNRCIIAYCAMKGRYIVIAGIDGTLLQAVSASALRTDSASAFRAAFALRATFASAFALRAAFAVAFALILALAAADDARAQLFSCKGEDGRTRYVSSETQCNSGSVKLPSSYAPPPAKKKSSGGDKTANSPPPPGRLPKISQQKQSRLDQKRGEILLYELRSEQKIRLALENLIADAEDESRRARLLKRRDEHARNIASIRRELSRLGYDAAAR